MSLTQPIADINDFEFSPDIYMLLKADGTGNEYIAQVTASKFEPYKVGSYLLVKTIKDSKGKVDEIIVGKINLDKTYGNPLGFTDKN